MKDIKQNLPEPKILIVEDDPDISFIIKKSLDSLNAEFTQAENGEEGLKLLLDKKYDLIISDLAMPILGGEEMITRFREQEKNRFTPILVLTAKVDLDTKISVLDMGGDEFISKPFNRKDLFARVSVLLRLNYLTQELFTRNDDLDKKNQEILALQATLLEEEREKTKNRIIITSLHKIRQPLTNTVLLSSMLQGDEKQQKNISRLKSSLAEIEKILEELESLDTSKINSYIEGIEMIKD
jgi:DNA-binding response OmpR family regulator